MARAEPRPTRLGEPDPERWRAAAAAFDALGAPYRAGRARLRKAEALLDAGAGRDEAADALSAAADAARSIGALRLLREAEQLAARARIDVGKAPERGAPASRRASTRCSAAPGGRPHQPPDRRRRCYISARTAGVHVSRILGKLGATASRARRPLRAASRA